MLLPLLASLPLAGCVAEQAIGPALVVGGASVVLTGRTPVDHVASLVTGQDCSVVRLERRESWCGPPPAPPPPQAFCTPSLGRVDCWTSPPSGSARQLADPPSPLPVAAPRPAPAPAPGFLTPAPMPVEAAPAPAPIQAPAAAPIQAPAPAPPPAPAPAPGATQPISAPAAPAVPPAPRPAPRRPEIRT